MSKVSKQKKRLAEAKKIALGLVQRRKQLSSLKRIAEKNDGITENQLTQAKSLIERINKSKVALVARGFDPNEAAGWAIEAQKKSQKSKRTAPKKQKRGGIGMYGLGNSIKIWN